MASSEPFDSVLRALSARSWDAGAARAERVAPLLYRARGDASELRRDYFDSAARNVALLDGLDEIGGRLAETGIRPVVLKGADLATRLYPTVALRPMSDVDLWVRPEEVDRAERVLAETGLEPFCPEMTPGLNRRARHARLFAGGAGIAVDLHWSLVGHAADRRAPDLEWFRSRTVPSEVGPWLVLDDTASLLYLAAHAKLQHWDERVPLLWLVDLFLLAHRDVDWEALEDAARAFGWEPALAASVREGGLRLGLDFPEPLEAMPGEVPAPHPEVRGGPERAVKELRDLDWRGRAALVASYLFPSRAYLRFRYRSGPSWSWPLLYPVRWARLLSSGLALVAKRLRWVRS